LSDEKPESKTGRPEERFLDPANLEAERREYVARLQQLIAEQLDAELARAARELSPGNLAEVLRPLNREETAHVLRVLPPDHLADVLNELDQQSLSALFDILDVDEIADLVEEMPSDEATDLLGELDSEQARQIMAAMEEEERGEVAELLQYPPHTAGGIMGKELATVTEQTRCRDAIEAVRGLDEQDLEEMHYVFVVDRGQRLRGQIPLVKLLLAEPLAMAQEIMEPDPPAVEVDLDQEAVALFVMTHDLISVPVVDKQGRLVGRITADDVLDVMEEEASEDISRMAGMSVEEFHEPSSLRVARRRLPWLLGGMGGEIGSMLVLRHFEHGLQAMVALAFFIPVIMAMGGNTGIQTSSVVVRGLATGEVDMYRMGRHLLRELLTALMTGFFLACCLFAIASVVVGDPHLAFVLGLSLLVVVLVAAMAGTGIPLILHRLGVDPAVATGPFITTANDVIGLLIYLGMASALLSLHGAAGPS
jgi:magnesium transporter